jgi:hypothetical protein
LDGAPDIVFLSPSASVVEEKFSAAKIMSPASCLHWGASDPNRSRAITFASVGVTASSDQSFDHFSASSFVTSNRTESAEGRVVQMIADARFERVKRRNRRFRGHENLRETHFRELTARAAKEGCGGGRCPSCRACYQRISEAKALKTAPPALEGDFCPTTVTLGVIFARSSAATVDSALPKNSTNSIERILLGNGRMSEWLSDRA